MDKKLFALLFVFLLGTSTTTFPAPAASAPPAQIVRRLDNNIVLAADGSSAQTLHVELTATNDAAAMKTGQLSVVYDAAMQDLEIVEAHTEKQNGEKIPVNVDAIYDQTPPGSAQLPMFTERRMKVIVYPQLAAGDTAVYTIKLTSKHSYFPGQYWYGELFPRTMSYGEVQETITAPKSLPLYVENYNVEFKKRDLGPNVIYRWHYSAPEPSEVVTEPTAPLSGTPRFFVSTFKDYAALGDAYAAEAQPKMVVTPKIQALADRITQGTVNRRDRAQKLYEWVSAHIRYVAIELGKGSLVPHDAETVLANGYGDCKDHAVLLSTLLKAKGIDSQTVLINNTTDYTLTEVPTFIQLNHAITWLPEFDLYLDSTAGVAPFGVLPFQEYGKPIVRTALSGSTVTTMPLLPPGATTVTTKTVAQLDKSGQLTGTTVTSATGPASIVLRMTGLAIQALGPDAAAAKQLASLGYGSDATGHLDADPPIALSPQYTIKGTFTASGWSGKLSDGESFFLPGGLRILGLSGDGLMGPFNPGSLKPDTELPCYSGEESEDLSLQAPDGVQFSSVPEDTHVETPYLTFNAHWSLAENMMTVHRNFTSRITQSICTVAIRKANADAIKKIVDSYDTKLSVTATYKYTPLDQSNAVPLPKPGEPSDPSLAALAAKGYNCTQTGGNDDASAWLCKNSTQHAEDIGQGAGDPELAEKLTDAQTAVKYNQNELALGLLSDILKRPNLPITASYPALYDRATVYTRTGRYDDALSDLTAALVLTPGDAWMLLARVHVYRLMGDWPHALADCNALLKNDPANAFALRTRADIFMEEARYEDAIRDYTAELQAASDPTSLVLRGIAYQRIGHHDDAAVDIRRATELGDAQAQSDFDSAANWKPAYAGGIKSETSLGQSSSTPDAEKAWLPADKQAATPAALRPGTPVAVLGITPPTPANAHETPPYPSLPRRLEEEGTVLVSFIVNTDGSVSDPTVAHSSGFPGLDDAALDAVKAWRYHPAMVTEKPITVRTETRFVWRLQNP